MKSETNTLDAIANFHTTLWAGTDTFKTTNAFVQRLPKRRAEATRNYLALETYINARRFKFEGLRERSPIVSCPMLDCTDEEQQLNRRSEFEVVEV